MTAHAPTACDGTPCPLHAPSDHHMRDWPTVLRMSGLIERTCAHGVGHPDPDSLAWLGGDGIHGCDGCCRRPR